MPGLQVTGFDLLHLSQAAIIVFHALGHGISIMADGGENSRDLVGSNASAYAIAANQHTAFGPAVTQRCDNGLGMIGA